MKKYNYIIALFTVCILFSTFQIIDGWNDINQYLDDGRSVLEYVCTDSWLVGRGEQYGFFINFISNGIYSIVYPKLIHCDSTSIFPLGVYMINLFMLFILLFSFFKFFSGKRITSTSFLLLFLALLYPSYSLSVASKELFLTLIALFFAISYCHFLVRYTNLNTLFGYKILQQSSHKNTFFCLCLLALSLLAVARVTYIIIGIALVFPPLSLLFKKHASLIRFSKIFVLFVILLPFTLILLDPSSFFVTKDPTGMTALFTGVLSRADHYSDDGLGFLQNAFSAPGIIHKYLVTIFSPNNLIQALEENVSTPLFFAFFGMKISCSFSILATFFFTIKFMFKTHLGSATSQIFLAKASLLVLSNSMVSAVLIYPYPHVRYYLPMVIPTIITLSLYQFTSRVDTVKLLAASSYSVRQQKL